jgi:hypothetical protein
MMLATCIGCGCDDLHACFDEAAGQPCSWLAVDYGAGLGVCSACPEHLERWQAGDRSIAVPVEPHHEHLGHEDLWCLWPDGTMCQVDDLEEYLTFLSDDFERVHVLEYAADGSPVMWAPSPRANSRPGLDSQADI